VTGTLRWAVLNNLYLDFFWMALQAVEKQLKAILLFNGNYKRAVSHRHEHRPDHAIRLTARMGSPLRSLRGQEFV
jgi:TRAP-type mannitol/chloroaromatic compound transport system permease small subunit